MCSLIKMEPSGQVLGTLVLSAITIISILPQSYCQHSQDFTYLGCFSDDDRRESLPDLVFCDNARDPYTSCHNTCGPRSENYCESRNMKVELCRDICADQNMKYFGLQAGSRCLCGGEFAPYNKSGIATGRSETCDEECSGNSSQKCGGNSQTSVYHIHESASNADCFNPGYVLNGDQWQPHNSSYSAGNVINFSSICPFPNTMHGANSITCSTSGNWTDLLPTCTVRCATPIAPTYARFSTGETLFESYAVSDEVLYECDYDPTRTDGIFACGYYGVWEAGKGAKQCPEACASDPCFETATCHDDRGDPDVGYMCHCPLGYQGQNCDLLQSGVTTPLCGQNFYNRTGVITSPNYPNNYGHDSDCSYLIRINKAESITFVVHDFISEPNEDYLSYGKGYSVYPDSGSTSADYPMLSGALTTLSGVSRKNKIFGFESDSVWIHWHSDSKNSERGFNISFSSVSFNCSHFPCHNNATCADLDDGSSICQCHAGWAGRRCKQNIDDCINSECANGDCADEVNAYHCVCDPGWTGRTCDIADMVTERNDCMNSPCMNSGQCVGRDGQIGYVCDCKPGYTGGRCEIGSTTTAQFTSELVSTMDPGDMAGNDMPAYAVGLLTLGVAAILTLILLFFTIAIQKFSQNRDRRNRVDAKMADDHHDQKPQPLNEVKIDKQEHTGEDKA